MDDTCTVLPLNLVDSHHQHLNSVDPNIQFTVKEEKDGQLPFLDILLSQDNGGSTSTSDYPKATHTDQYLLPVTPSSGTQASSDQGSDVQG